MDDYDDDAMKFLKDISDPTLEELDQWEQYLENN